MWGPSSDHTFLWSEAQIPVHVSLGGDDVKTAEAEDMNPTAQRLDVCFTAANISQLLDH